jgi:hypothetical protein
MNLPKQHVFWFCPALRISVRIPLTLGLLTFASLTCGALSVPSEGKACGPPNYCARTDQKIEPYAKNPPALGPAGSSVVDPSFGTRILRVTDDGTDPKRHGDSIMTPSSAEENPWNSTSTRFYVVTSGGAYLIYDFDPATVTAHPSRSSDVAWGGEPEFSYTQPSILYGLSPRSTEFKQYDIGSGKTTILHDASSCVRLKSEDTGHSITVSSDDKRMETTLGPRQGDNYIAYVYDREKGCRWYNTLTGEIGGNWGPKGIIPTSDRFTIHNLRMSKSGKYIYIARAAKTPDHPMNEPGKHWTLWEVDTMNVVPCTVECSGHRALGYSHLISPSGKNHPMDLLIRQLDNVTVTKPLISGLGRTEGYWYDQHFSWNNTNADDTNPVCLTTYRPGNPNVPAAPLAVDGPWENEVLCVETDGKASKIWRFAHTYSTAKNGFWSTPRGNISPDGRFFMFTSDWEDQLGQTPNGKKYRTDVFLVELR